MGVRVRVEKHCSRQSSFSLTPVEKTISLKRMKADSTVTHSWPRTDKKGCQTLLMLGF